VQYTAVADIGFNYDILGNNSFARRDGDGRLIPLAHTRGLGWEQVLVLCETRTSANSRHVTACGRAARSAVSGSLKIRSALRSSLLDCEQKKWIVGYGRHL